DFVIYNSAVSAATVAKGGVLFPVYDSAGYISYTADGSVKTPVSAIEGGLAGLNAEIRDWWLYDRNRDLISDSAGNSYYTSASGSSVGRVYGANTSCVNLKSGSPAGYVVQVMAREGASAATGSAIGYYVIEPVNLYRECAFHSATLNGQEWLWDPVKAKFYTLGGGAGDAGKRDYDVSVPFTGLSHEPSVSLSYGDFALVEGVHYRMSYGDPDPESGGVASCAGAPNRNVTTVEGAERAGFSVLPQNTNNMSNFIVAYFDITPAALEDCEVSLASDEWAYTGNAVEPPVTVTLNGVELQKDVDFTVTYADNVERGMASWKVEPLANLGGGELSEVSGTFRIVDGEDLTAAFTLDAIADQQFNWGYDVHPALTFRKNTGSGNLGAAVNLVEGVDYTVSYSTKSITKWPDGKYAQTAPCTVTVNGAGRYTGALSATFDIVPYDAAANATGQLRAYVQDVSYGMWGKAPTGTKADADGAVYPTHETATVGLEYPIMAVQARPIIDWAAYENAVATGFDPEESGCYGTALNMTTSNNNAIGGLVNRYPGRYYDADGVEVNGNGGVYTDASGAIIAYPQVAEPGTISAKVELRCGTGGVHAGAVGMLDCGTFEYGAALDLSKVTWSVMGDCVYDGTEKHPVVGTTQSGAVLVESSGAGGSDGDYAISYSQDDNAVDAGTVHYTVTAVEGEGKHFTGTFQGAFSILPASLADADDVRLVYDQEYVVEDASVGVCPKPEVFKGQALLEEGKDYTIDYTSNTTQGTGMFLVRGMGNYTGSVSGTFGIVESGTLNNVVVSGVASAPWSGLPVKCEPVLKDGDRVLVEGTDYTVAYLRDGKATEDFTSCGTITVHLVGVGGYRGTRDVDYTVVGRDFTLAKATAAGVFYTGKEQSPVVTVRYDGEVLSSDLYTVSPVAATDAGTYRISVTSAGGQYTPASITCDFVISKAVNGLAATTKDPGAVAYSTSARTVSNPVSATGAQGAVTFAKASGDPRLKVAANGAITVAAKTPAGTYELGVATRAAGDANHNAASVIRTVRIVVAKAPNTLKVAGKTVAVKAVKLKKSAQKLKVAKVRTVKENISKGKITYKKASGNKKIAVAKSGKMTLKKGLAKGAYKVKVKATSKATANYTAKTVAFTVKVRVS
ncbi:MAG TPA: hypothetical protein DCP91_11935, partial [Eggerthellaceae bacterium]|nr:hypothetical protein [Eggerthellaceae bacterium]